MDLDQDSLSTTTPNKKRRRNQPETGANYYASMIQDAKSSIMKLLDEDDDRVLPCLHALKDPNFGKKNTTQSIVTAKPFPRTYNKLHLTPKEDLYRLFTDLCPEKFPSTEFVRTLEKNSKGTVHKLMIFGFAVCSTHPWPPQMHDRDVWASVWADIHKERGERLRMVVISSAKSVVEFDEFGVYRFDLADGYPKTHIVHVPSGVAAELDQARVHTAETKHYFEMNHDEISAKVVVGKLKVDACSFFDDSTKGQWFSYRSKELLAAKAAIALSPGASGGSAGAVALTSAALDAHDFGAGAPSWKHPLPPPPPGGALQTELVT